jgi:hypothetical protein
MNEHKGTADPDWSPTTTVLACIPWIWGAKEIQVTLDQARRLASEPKQVIAEALGVSYEDYLIWLSWTGSAQCEATTAKGRRCRATVPDLRFEHPRQLREYGGGYCTVHADVTAR